MDQESTRAGEVDSDHRQALHEIELGVEWLKRAHGNLVAFHHNTGHAMDHLATAERQLRDCDETALADAIRDDFLPRGVVDEDRWSYDVLEDFEDGVLAAATEFEQRACVDLADGQRHVTERIQEHNWKNRAEQDETEH